MKKIRTSAIITAFNSEKYIREALESVLRQTLSPDEIILIDDGSTDKTREVVSFCKDIKYFFQENQGPGAARNRGISEASGDFVAFLDADDIWCPQKTEIQNAVFQNDSAAQIVGGYAKNFWSPEFSKKEEFAEAPGFLPSALLIRKKIFEKVGLFRTDVRVGEFVDWFGRVEEADLNFKMLPELVLLRRLHDNNLGTRMRGARGDYAAILKDRLLRRRRPSSS